MSLHSNTNMFYEEDVVWYISISMKFVIVKTKKKNLKFFIYMYLCNGQSYKYMYKWCTSLMYVIYSNITHERNKDSGTNEKLIIFIIIHSNNKIGMKIHIEIHATHMYEILENLIFSLASTCSSIIEILVLQWISYLNTDIVTSSCQTITKSSGNIVIFLW